MRHLLNTYGLVRLGVVVLVMGAAIGGLTGVSKAVRPGGAAPAAWTVATYKITVTGHASTETTGNYEPVEEARGTSNWTSTFPRVTFLRDARSKGSVTIRGEIVTNGTLVDRFDNQAGVCRPDGLPGRSRGTNRAEHASLAFDGYDQTSGGKPFKWAFVVGSNGAGLPRGDEELCSASHGIVQLDLGQNAGGKSNANFSSAGSFHLRLSGIKRNGRAGFPLDKLLAAKAFSYSASGTIRVPLHTGVPPRYFARVTNASMRIVFTPVQ